MGNVCRRCLLARPDEGEILAHVIGKKIFTSYDIIFSDSFLSFLPETKRSENTTGGS